MTSLLRTQRRERLVKVRVYQCPGCWSYAGFKAGPDVDIECECGERMTIVDLRERDGLIREAYDVGYEDGRGRGYYDGFHSTVPREELRS